MGIAGFMGEIDEEREREREAFNLQRLYERINQTQPPHVTDEAPRPSENTLARARRTGRSL